MTKAKDRRLPIKFVLMPKEDQLAMLRANYKKYNAMHNESEKARKMEYYYKHRESTLIKLRAKNAYKREWTRLSSICI